MGNEGGGRFEEEKGVKRKTKMVRTGRGEEEKGGVVHFQNKLTFLSNGVLLLLRQIGGRGSSSNYYIVAYSACKL